MPNILVLDRDPCTAAMYHNDFDTKARILQCCHFLCEHDGMVVGYEGLHNPDYDDHPLTKWTRKTLGNWFWVRRLGLALCGEFELRYPLKDRMFTNEYKLKTALAVMKVPRFIDHSTQCTPFIQHLPNRYRCRNPVNAYRLFYRNEIKKISTYTNTDWPKWLVKK